MACERCNDTGVVIVGVTPSYTNLAGREVTTEYQRCPSCRGSTDVWDGVAEPAFPRLLPPLRTVISDGKEYEALMNGEPIWSPKLRDKETEMEENQWRVFQYVILVNGEEKVEVHDHGFEVAANQDKAREQIAFRLGVKDTIAADGFEIWLRQFP